MDIKDNTHGPDTDGSATAGNAAPTAATAGNAAPTAAATATAATASDDASRPGSAPGATRGPGGKFLPKSADAGPGARKRKRGRPAKSDADARAKADKPKTDKLALAKLDAATLARVLAFAHSAAALSFRMPALALADDEARRLAVAIAELATHYDIEISAKLMAWLQLAGVGAAVYGPRAVAIVASRKVQRGPAAAAAAASSSASAGAPKMNFGADMPGNNTVN